MDEQWTYLVSKVEQAEAAWDARAASLPEQLQIPQPPNSLSKSAMSAALSRLVGLVKTLSGRHDIDPILFAVHVAGLRNNLDALASSMANLPGGPGHVWNVVNNIWGARSALVWLTPPDIEGEFLGLVKNEIASGEFTSVQKSLDGTREATKAAKAALADITTSLESAKTLTEQIKGSEREASTAKTNSQASAANAAAEQQKIGETLQSLDAGLKQYRGLAERIEQLKDDADRTLEAASKVGLARSFSDRYDNLARARFLWLALFMSGIGALVSIPSWLYGYVSVLIPKETPLIWELGVRAMLEAPIIWFTWWAVKQYGHTNRLLEDYAFKKATALAFIGYRKEMGDDAEMLKLLRESAIKNFGDNPIRILGEKEPSTPGHEILEKVFDKSVLSKLADLVKAIKG